MKETIEINPVDEEVLERPEVATRPGEDYGRSGAERQRRGVNGKKRRKKKRILRLFVVFLFIGAAIYLMSLDYFNVKTIKVEGNTTISVEQVLKDAGIKEGSNIFWLNKSRVIKKMEVNPYYGKIEVNKNIPSEIVLTIEERIPSIALPYGGKFVVLDENGVVLEIEKENPKLTEIVGITIESMDKGKVMVAKEAEEFASALRLVKAANKYDLFFMKIKISDGMAICNVYDGLSVKGSVDEVMANMENGNLQNILYDLYSKKITRGTVKITDGKYCSFTPIVE